MKLRRFASLSPLLLSLLPACGTSPGPGGSGGSSGGLGTGGAPGTGGALGSGGAFTTGGNGAGGQSPGTGGATGGTSTGGNANTGGTDGGSGGLPGSDCTPNGQARNPIVSHIFTADPSAKVFEDRIYVYTSHDADGQTGYEMIDYHAYSSDDLVNWRDHGVIIAAADLSWADYLYAPDACEKDGQYYLYMPNNGSAIGVAVADDPGGPFVDALGEPLITNSTPGVGDVDWIFDPTCFIDDDGQAYLYFGGGPQDSGDNARVIRLNDDMVSLMDSSATTIPAPFFFEASFMHKRNGTYYYSYSTNFVEHNAAYLDYMTSDDPMTGFSHRGSMLTSGDINSNDNNHGSVVDFAGKTYIFYHNRKAQKDAGGSNNYQRSAAIQELTYETDGTITEIAMSTADTTVAQLKCLDGYAEVEAETIAAQSGIEVEGDGEVGVSVTSIDAGDWVGYSQVDFRTGTTRLVARVASAGGGPTIEVRIDGCDDFTSQAGTAIGSCTVVSTGGADTYADLACDLTETAGPHDLCLVFAGTGTVELDSFHLE